MTYHGGAVQTSPRVCPVLWGANWFSGGDPYGVAKRLHLMYHGLGGSGWANVLKQYSSNYGRFSNPTGQYKGWIQDTSFLPSRPTATDMANAAVRAARRMNDFGYNGQFVVATPWGVVDQYTQSQKACAWHYYTTIPNTTSVVSR